MRKLVVTSDFAFEHIFSKYTYSGEYLASWTLILDPPYYIRANCHYFLSRHFVVRYLKLRCRIDCNHPITEVTAEFAAAKCNFPFEYIIRQFLLQKLRRIIQLIPKSCHNLALVTNKIIFVLCRLGGTKPFTMHNFVIALNCLNGQILFNIQWK